MEDDSGIRKFLELIFVKESGIFAETTDFDSSIPPCLLTNDFPHKLRKVLLTKQAVLSLELKKSFHALTIDLNNPRRDYVANIVIACQAEHRSNTNVFESFIAVCSVVRYLSKEFSSRFGITYFDMNCDIIMEFYKSVLKKTFLRRGGFLRLIEYVHQHKYLEWNLDLSYLYDPSVDISEDTDKKLDAELIKTRSIWTLSIKQCDWHKLEEDNDVLIRKILSIASANLSTVTSTHDPNKKLNTPDENEKANKVETRRKEEKDLKAIQRFEDLEETSQRYIYLDSKSKHSVKQKEEIARYENIIEAVIKHNRSKRSGLVKSVNPVQKQVMEILGSLKSKIDALIQVLDEDDEE